MFHDWKIEYYLWKWRWEEHSILNIFEDPVILLLFYKFINYSKNIVFSKYFKGRNKMNLLKIKIFIFLKRILKVIKKPEILFIYILNFRIFRFIQDKNFLKIKYWLKTGKKLDLSNPRTFNEKLQWLKLYDRNPKYKDLVDKCKVRSYISKTIGSKYLIPLIGVYNSFEEINFDKLPNEFVLKPNHTSGNIFICRDKSKIYYNDLKKKVNKWLKKDYYWFHREWCYKNIMHKIICEKYMVDESGEGLKDYKFFCFNGEVKAMFVATNRFVDTRFDFFDLDFNHLPFMQHYPNANIIIKKPKGFEEMIRLAKILSKDIPHIRVDFYDINSNVYFGELTFFHFSGFEKFEPEKYDEIFGSWLKLPIRQ